MTDEPPVFEPEWEEWWPSSVPDEEHVARIMADFGLSEGDAWVFLRTSRGGDGDVVGLPSSRENPLFP